MRKNILILGHSYGMQFLESCNQHAQLFDRNEYNVTVAYLVGEPNEEIRQKTLAENVVFFDFAKKAIRGMKIGPVRKMLVFCREKQFDTVICNRFKPTYIMIWVAQFCAIPRLFFVMHAIGTFKPVSRKLLVTCLLKPNMIFVGVSNAVREDLRRTLFRVPSKHIITLYNIIDYQLYEPQLLSREKAREELHLSDDTFVFGHIGRFVAEKNQQSLIHAFSLIKPTCPTAKLVIIGDGRLEEELKTLVEQLGLENQVIFVGFVPDGFRFMRAFDTFVLCSVKESFGRVLLEAMIARIPILATRAYGIPEVVGDAGFLIESGNTQKLADEMQRIYHMSKEELNNWGDKGYRRMLNYFSPAPSKKTFWQLPIMNNKD